MTSLCPRWSARFVALQHRQLPEPESVACGGVSHDVQTWNSLRSVHKLFIHVDPVHYTKMTHRVSAECVSEAGSVLVHGLFYCHIAHPVGIRAASGPVLEAYTVGR